VALRHAAAISQPIYASVSAVILDECGQRVRPSAQTSGTSHQCARLVSHRSPPKSRPSDMNHQPTGCTTSNHSLTTHPTAQTTNHYS
jgi:hypothetical protein